MKHFFFTLAFAILFFSSCTNTSLPSATVDGSVRDYRVDALEFGILLPTMTDTEAEMQEMDSHTGATVRSILNADATRTSLGEKNGISWPNVWMAGDVISVNGILSDVLKSESPYVGGDYALFALSGPLSMPYHYAYPGTILSNYEEGSAHISLPLKQNWSSSTYDSSAFVMLGKGTARNLSLSSMMAAVSLSVPGNYASGKWASVRFESLGNEKVSGMFTTDFSSVSSTSSASSSLSLDAPEGGVDWGSSVIFLIPAQTYTDGVRITVYATDDTKMTQVLPLSYSVLAGRLYPLKTDEYSPDL